MAAPAVRARHPTPSPPRRRQRWPIIVGVVCLVLAIGVIVLVTVVNRVETGRWEVPDREDFVRVFTKGSGPVSKTIFLERKPITLAPGRDDAPRGISSVVASSRTTPAKLPGWKGSDAGWKSLLACTRRLFEPFDAVVTDIRPSHEDFILVAVGGRPADLSGKSSRITGLAPFNGDVISRAVVFAFSAAQGNDPHTTCETIGMEVAHAYGLDHAFDCHDVMTYLPPCGPKKFVDKEIRCGEGKARACEGGATMQNSFRRLLAVLGARRP
jgi:hypothetical protein